MKILARKIPVKAVLVFVVVTLGIAAVACWSLAHYRSSMMVQREQKVRAMVENVYVLVDFYYQKIAHEGMTEEEAKQYTFQAIRELPYDINGYVWINDMQGVMIMHPILPEINGKYLYDYQDSNGVYLFREFIKTVETIGAGFVAYTWPKPDEPKDKEYPKLSYVRDFAPWGWIIGSGIYIDDVDTAFRQAIYVSGGLVLAGLLFVVALILTFSESFKKP
ncbi:MAG: cache domain-containing protein [Alphaproteobacteria bacterium]|nr:cache domain-containing protein [Alphaproteobacteria bacterium]